MWNQVTHFWTTNEPRGNQKYFQTNVNRNAAHQNLQNAVKHWEVYIYKCLQKEKRKASKN